MQGKSVGAIVQFTCTLQGKKGAAAGPLGAHLLLACVNLVALGYHDKVVLLEEGPPPNSLSRQAGQVHDQEKEVSIGIKHLRQVYIDFLSRALEGKSLLQQTELLEDDDLCNAWMEAFTAKKDFKPVLDLAAKCEDDRCPGPVCGIGPRGLEHLRSCLNLDCAFTTLKDVARAQTLPKAFALVNHDNHWVPMWLKTEHPPFASRPWLPETAYDTYIERFGPVAEAAGAYTDLTSRAAGDCGFHGLLIIKKLAAGGVPATPAPAAAPAQRAPPDPSYGAWTSSEQAVWQMTSPTRIKYMQWGRGAKAWWAVSRTGAKLGKRDTAQEACQLWLQFQEYKDDL